MTNAAQPAPVNGPRILVVDDEQLIRWSIRQRLERAGYSVSTAESGEECLEMLPRVRPDVLLVDVRLAGIDGLEVLRLAREQWPELAVIMLSAHGTVDIAVQAMKQGALDFITKPFDLGALETVLARALETVRLRRQVAGLTAERDTARSSERIVGEGPSMQELRDLVAKVARSDASTVLIQGESGSGKDVVARAIHFMSRRGPRPFMTINCTSLPEPLVESELFGHERGAFTDAKAQKKGLFELADGGTVLLDEIGDMPPGAQAKLLRVIEEKTFKRVGGTIDLRVDVRMIAATHRDLSLRVSEERFRQDLYFRLNILTIRVPPLREHKEDLPALAAHFVALFNRELRRNVKEVTPAAMDLVTRYDWPGNVRELRNVIERAFILEAADAIGPEHLPPEIRTAERPPTPSAAPRGAGLDGEMNIEKLEERLVRAALERVMGNQSKAAELLGISRDALRYRMKKMGLL